MVGGCERRVRGHQPLLHLAQRSLRTQRRITGSQHIQGYDLCLTAPAAPGFLR